MPSTPAVASANPRFPRVVASFAAAASSSTNAFTPSTANLAAIAAAATPAASNAGPSTLAKPDPTRSADDPKSLADLSAESMLRLKFAVSAAKYTIRVRPPPIAISKPPAGFASLRRLCRPLDPTHAWRALCRMRLRLSSIRFRHRTQQWPRLRGRFDCAAFSL